MSASPLHVWVVSDACIDPQHASSQLHVFQVIEALLKQGHRVSYSWLMRNALSPSLPPAVVVLAQRQPSFRICGLYDPGSVRDCGVLYLVNWWTAETLASARKLVWQLRRTGHRFLAVLDTMDCLYKAVGLFLDESARTVMRQLEMNLHREVDHRVMISELECREAMQAFGMLSQDYSVVAQAYDPYQPGFARGWEQRRQICFVGSTGPTNRQALGFFLDHVFPHLLQRMPDLELHVLGNRTDELNLNYPPAILERVRLRGYIADIEAEIASYRLQVVPLLTGAGIKGKILQSLACGTPVISTIKGVEGMQLAQGREVLVVDTEEEFVQAVCALHDDAALWARLQAGGGDYMRRHYSFEVLDAQVAALVQRLRQLAA